MPHILFVIKYVVIRVDMWMETPIAYISVSYFKYVKIDRI